MVHHLEHIQLSVPGSTIIIYFAVHIPCMHVCMHVQSVFGKAAGQSAGHMDATEAVIHDPSHQVTERDESLAAQAAVRSATPGPSTAGDRQGGKMPTDY